MTLRKKILLCSAGTAALALILFAAALFLAPLYLNTPAARAKVQAVISQRLGGKVVYEKLDLSFFPRPLVVIHQVTLSVPGKAIGTLASVSLSLQRLPFIRGNVLVSKIYVDGPDINIIIPKVGKDEKTGPETPAEARIAIRSVLSSLESFGPGLVIEIDRGRLTVTRDRRPLLILRNIAARFTAPPGEQEFAFKAATEQSGLFTLSGSYHIDEEMVGLNGLSAALGPSSLSGITARLLFSKPPRLEVLAGRARLSLSELHRLLSSFNSDSPFLKNVQTIEGMVDVSSLKISGPLLRPEMWETALAGTVERVLLDMPLFPGTLAVSRGEFSVAQDSVSLSTARASMLDTAMSLSGVLSGLRRGIRSAELSLQGTMGNNSLSWAYTKTALPREFMMSGPLTFSDVRLRWRKKAGTYLSGTVVSPKGTALSFDGLLNAPEFTIRRAIITDDGDTNAAFTMRRSGKSLELSFTGRLAESTMDKVFEQKTFGKGTIRGGFSATIILDRPVKFAGRGRLEGNDLVIPWGLSTPVRIDGIALRADGDTFTVTSSSVTWGNAHYSVAGTVTTSEDGFVLDMDVTADRINVAEIQRALARPRQANGRPPSVRRARPAVLGVVRVKTPSLTYDRFTFSPVEAIVSLASDEVSMAFTRAETCGITLPGTLAFSRREVRFEFKPAAAGQNLDSSLTCLAGEDLQLTGNFDLTADIRARGRPGALLSLLEGSADFRAKKGKIYRYPLLAKIFSVLSVTEIFRGKIPELGGSGFPYRSLTVKGEIHHGVLQLEQAYLSGSSLDLIADGEVDLAAKKINLTVLVAPFSTLNSIIRHIPLIGKIMGGTLISVPVNVSGDLADPDVTFLAPSAVGKRIVTLLENILKLPVEIISPLLPREKKKGD